MQLVLLLVHDDSVPGVVAALIADHYVRAGRQQICQLPFAFIAPLSAYDHCDCHWVHRL